MLDTHVLVWLRAGDKRLGVQARRAIEEAHANGDLAVSAISFWEVAMLMDLRRIKLRMGPSTWRQRILDDGVTEIPVTGDIGIRATELLPSHADPADRMSVATAQSAQAALCTADGPVLGMP
ncbi:MAG: type II toxin-antitoxin system VapC family toxin, partial [Oceanococcaceae bacterium]